MTVSSDHYEMTMEWKNKVILFLIYYTCPCILEKKSEKKSLIEPHAFLSSY